MHDFGHLNSKDSEIHDSQALLFTSIIIITNIENVFSIINHKLRNHDIDIISLLHILLLLFYATFPQSPISQFLS